MAAVKAAESLSSRGFPATAALELMSSAADAVHIKHRSEGYVSVGSFLCDR